MKHTGFIAGLVIAATSLTAVTALAQGPGGMHRQNMSFQSLDTDGNGEITKEEMDQRRVGKFTDADSDGDGMLSREEMVTAGRKNVEGRVDHMLERFDANGDGALTMDEMPKPRRTGGMFNRMDRDGNGGVSQAEFDDARAHMKGRKKRHSGKN